MLPRYLQSKLASLAIYSKDELKLYDYRVVYQQLLDIFPSLSRKVLFDLYCLVHDLELNSLEVAQKDHILDMYKTIGVHYFPLKREEIDHYLGIAEQLAEANIGMDEIPIAAIVILDGEIVGRGCNKTIDYKDITAHAEIIALKEAALKLGNHRLTECDLYVTIEPCTMCVGAIIHSRVKRVVFGAIEPKTGAIVSQYRLLDNRHVNFHTEAIGPIDSERYSKLLRNYLITKRKSTNSI